MKKIVNVSDHLFYLLNKYANVKDVFTVSGGGIMFLTEALRRNKKIKPPEALWKKAGYKKKATCDRCSFRSRYAGQLLVCHMDGNMRNVSLNNLRTVCLNCMEEVKRLDIPWVPNQLQADR